MWSFTHFLPPKTAAETEVVLAAVVIQLAGEVFECTNTNRITSFIGVGVGEIPA